MFRLSELHSESSCWPARAAKFLADGKYSRAVEICREYLNDTSHLVSGRLIYAEALFRAGQVERATEQFYRVLSLDPDHLVALKFLGDIGYAAGDELTALANYQRILEIDPGCRGIRSEIRTRKTETTRTVTIQRQPETTSATPKVKLREIPFYTETVGDLYLLQGHPRLAACVFQNLLEKNDNPRLREKFAKAEQKIITKES